MGQRDDEDNGVARSINYFVVLFVRTKRIYVFTMQPLLCTYKKFESIMLLR